MADRWREVEDVFYRALDVPAEERKAFLDSACDAEVRAEVLSLLAHDLTMTTPLSQHVANAMVDFDGRTTTRKAGPYELLEEIGRGGMGTVYKARRADDVYDAVVAVKLVRPGMDTDFVLSRFRRERQTLARLNHPNIARLLDGGSTAEEIPYIVMEYIDGVRITEYCTREKFSLEQRLRLFLPVCLAVDYAHRNFVVHRDIKPGNILVDTTGTPKLLDFGICKLLHANPLGDEEALTREVAVLTPDYASPEQILGEAISARSDVYSLGAVLYELLTEARPHRIEKFTPVAIEEAICNTPVKPPSEAAPAAAAELRGDLDNIVMRALEKDSERRYESAAALAQDIQRHLDHVPVAARPATARYRLRKFMVRHRVLVTAVLAVLAASMIGTVVSVAQLRRAEARERELRSLAKVFLFEVHDSIRDLPGATATRQKVVNTAVSYLDALAGDAPADPEILRDLASGYQRIGDIDGSDSRGSNLGDMRAAMANYTKALKFWDRLLAAKPGDLPAAINKLTVLRLSGDLQRNLAGTSEALALYDRAERDGRILLAKHPTSRELRGLMIEVLMAGSRRRRDANEIEASLRSGTEALELVTALSAEHPNDTDLAVSLSSAEANVGMAKARLGDLTGAVDLYRRAVDRNEQLVATQPTSVNARRNLMISYSHLADTLGYPDLPNLGDRAGAEAVYSKMAALAEQLHRSDGKDARAASDLGIALMRWAAVSDGPLKEERLKKSRGLFQRLLADQPKNLTMLLYLGVVEFQLGQFYESTGQRAAALGHWRRALDVTEPHGSKAASLARVVVNTARVLAPLELDPTAGATRIARAMEVAEKSAAGKGPNVTGRILLARMFATEARYHARWGNRAAALEWREKALKLWRELATQRGFIENDRRDLAEMEQWKP